jgi:branched-chain amino acid transport system ATP-binding protein
MLAIAAALACGPELLLVDELSLGLAPLVVQELAKRLRAIRDELGITILVVEQNAPVALGIADWGYVMENGRVVLDVSADRLASHQDVREFYLGATGTTGAGARGTTGEGARRSYRDVKQYRRSRRWYG